MKKLIVLFFFSLFVVIILLNSKINQFYNQIYIKKNHQKKTSEKTIKEQKVFNILLLGYGGKGHQGAYLTDTMIILHLDTEKKKAVLISLPRDIWVKIPTKSNQDFHSKINTVYQMGLFPKNYPDLKDKYKDQLGAGKLIKFIVGGITGLKIDNYGTVNFTGFKNAIDILGGVNVVVEKSFDDYQYPIAGKRDDLCGRKEEELPELEKIATETPQVAFPCRYEHLHFDAGKTQMNGETALKYVRSRHALQDGGDFSRARRQQRFLEAVKDKVLSIGFIPKIIPLLNEMGNNVKTDIPIELTKKFLKEADNIGSYKITSLILSTDNVLKSSHSSYGGYILIPKKGIDNWSKVRLVIKNKIKGIKPSQYPTKTKK